MYGMVNRAVQEMVTSRHGLEVWERILSRAGTDIEVFIRSEAYPDDITYRLVGAVSEELEIPAEQVLEQFGVHWILKTAQKGYSAMLAANGTNVKEFLTNLPNFHSRLSMMFPHLSPPEFSCSDVDCRSVRMHYRSKREGLAPFVRGLFLGVGEMFSVPLSVEQTAFKSAGADHDEFVVRW